MKLIDYLLTVFEIRSNTVFGMDCFGKHITFREFIQEIKYFLVIIRNLKVTYGNDLTFALMGENSTSYISCYIALILSSVDFCLIPHKMSDKTIKSIIINEDINVVFCSDYCSSLIRRKDIFYKFKLLPWFKEVVSLQTKLYSFHKLDSMDEINAGMYEFIISKEAQSLREVIREHFKPRQRTVSVFSSGVDKTSPHTLYFDDDTIYESILKLSDSLLLPDFNYQRVYSEVDYSYAPIWTILLPLVDKGIFVANPSQAEILLESSISFEDKWNFVTGELYETRIIGKLLMKDWLYWLFRIVTRHLLKKHFNYVTKKKAIIIINAFLSPRILKTVLAKLPIYTTYGMQECNHILAINDYSENEMFEDSCVGTLLKGVSGDIKSNASFNRDEGSLTIASKLLASNLTFEKDVWWDTRDHASIKNDLLFIYGKMRYSIKDSIISGANLENVERIIKSIPYFKEVMIFKDHNEDYHVVVYPNVKTAEAIQHGLLYIANVIKPFVKILNDSYGPDFFADIKIMHSDFLKSHTGKIRKGAYIAVIEEEL